MSFVSRAARLALLAGGFLAPATLAAQGAPLDCHDLSGKPVRRVADSHIPYPAYVTEDGHGRPVIYWNPNRFNGRSRTYRTFAMLHECGHLRLRHLEHPTGTLEDRRREEREADCFAIEALYQSHSIKGGDLDELMTELGQSVGDRTHLGGQDLLDALEQCLRERDDGHRWDETLDQVVSASRDRFSSITGAWLGTTWAGEVHESTLDLPGTFDCEIRPPGSLVCLVEAAEDEQGARRRYGEVRKIIENWLPQDWTHDDREPARSSQRELFLAQSSLDGTFLALVRTSASRVYLVARPGDH